MPPRISTRFFFASFRLSFRRSHPPAPPATIDAQPTARPSGSPSIAPTPSPAGEVRRLSSGRIRSSRLDFLEAFRTPSHSTLVSIVRPDARTAHGGAQRSAHRPTQSIAHGGSHGGSHREAHRTADRGAHGRAHGGAHGGPERRAVALPDVRTDVSAAPFREEFRQGRSAEERDRRSLRGSLTPSSNRISLSLVSGFSLQSELLVAKWQNHRPTPTGLRHWINTYDARGPQR